jgi:tripartite tricarboxylate transporter TctB family protein
MKFLTRVSRLVVDHPDRLSGTLILFLAAFAWLESFHLPFGSIRGPDAGFFPQVLSILLFLTSIAILAHSFSREAQITEFSRRSWLVPISAIVLVGYALVLPSAGFVLATAAVMLLIMRGLVKMRWVRALLISIPTVVISYLAFVKLGVPLPQGPLPF